MMSISSADGVVFLTCSFFVSVPVVFGAWVIPSGRKTLSTSRSIRQKGFMIPFSNGARLLSLLVLEREQEAQWLPRASPRRTAAPGRTRCAGIPARQRLAFAPPHLARGGLFSALEAFCVARVCGRGAENETRWSGTPQRTPLGWRGVSRGAGILLHQDMMARTTSRSDLFKFFPPRRDVRMSGDSHGRYFRNSHLRRSSFTTCQITFSVMPSPQTVPVRLTQRNNRPSAIGADLIHASMADFTHSGTCARLCR